MPTPPDPIIPTAAADSSGAPTGGDYLAPPPVLRMPLSRRLAILLLCATLLFNGVYAFVLLGKVASGKADWKFFLPISGGLAVVQFFAIFRSHKWPTFAIWLALVLVVVGFFIESVL